MIGMEWIIIVKLDEIRYFCQTSCRLSFTCLLYGLFYTCKH